MSELISNLNTIESVKTDIKSAIEAKGVSMSGFSFPDYPAAIGSITTSFVTTTLSTSVNGTFIPTAGVDGYSQVVVEVPQSVTGWTTRNFIEGSIYSSIVYDPSASKVAEKMFYGRSIVTTVSLPQCTSIYSMAFYGCTKLSEISLPMCKNIGYGAFMNAFHSANTNVNIDLPECSFINNQAFYYTLKLGNITLGSNTMCTLGGNGNMVFEDAGNNYSIYVPSSLVDTYKENRSWSYISSRIFPIPE